MTTRIRVHGQSTLWDVRAFHDGVSAFVWLRGVTNLGDFTPDGQEV